MNSDADKRLAVESAAKPSPGWLFAGGAALLVLLTYLWLVRFAYPANDDWSFATAGRDVGVWAAFVAYWNDFGGRWASILPLHALGWFSDLPAVYPLLTALVFAALVGAGWPLLYALGLRERRLLWIGTLILAAVQFTALPVLDIGDLGPHVAMPETVYWQSGALSYAIAYPILTLTTWLACTTRRAWLGWLVAVVGGVVVSGLSEMAGILAVTLGVSLGLAGWRRGWVLAAAAAAGFGLVACAPGNLKRLAVLREQVQAGAGSSKLPRAMLDALWMSGGHLRYWLLNPAVVALCGGAAWWGSLTREAAGVHPRRRVLIAGLATLAAIWSMAVPTFALVGFLEARHESLVSLTAIAGLLVTAVLAGRAWPDRLQGLVARRAWLAWMAAAILIRCLLPSPIEPTGVEWLARLGLCAGLLCVVLGLYGRQVAGVLLALGLVLQPAWWQAVMDACVKAPELYAKQRARDDEVRRLIASGITSIALPWLGDKKKQPRTIRIYELQPGWMVDGYAGYYRLSRVRLSPRVTSPMELVLRPAPEAPAATP